MQLVVKALDGQTDELSNLTRASVLRRIKTPCYMPLGTKLADLSGLGHVSGGFVEPLRAV